MRKLTWITFIFVILFKASSSTIKPTLWLDMENNECADDWVTFIDGDSNYNLVIGSEKYCGKNKPYEVMVSSGHEMTIYFHTNSFLELKGFDIIITIFHEGSCRNFETRCDNGRCIHGELQCNGYNSCGDYSACDGDRSEGSYIGIIIGSCASVFMLVVIVVAIVVFAKCRRSPTRSLGIQGHVVGLGTLMAITYGIIEKKFKLRL